MVECKINIERAKSLCWPECNKYWQVKVLLEAKGHILLGCSKLQLQTPTTHNTAIDQLNPMPCHQRVNCFYYASLLKKKSLLLKALGKINSIWIRTPLTLISPKSYLKGEQHNKPTAPPLTPTMVIIPPLANQRILFLGCTYNTPHTPTSKSIQFLFQICQNHSSHICKIIKFSPKKSDEKIAWPAQWICSKCNAMCFQWSSESVSTPQLSVFPMPPVNLPLCYSWHTQAVQCRSRRTWNLLFTAFYGRATVNSALGRETPQSRSHPTYIPKSIALRWSTAQTNLLMCKRIHYCTNQPTIVQNNPLLCKTTYYCNSNEQNWMQVIDINDYHDHLI